MKRTPRESAVIHGLNLTHRLRLLALITVLVATAGCGESGTVGSPAGINSASLSWEKPTTNVDDSPITDLAGYQIYFGTSSGNYTEVLNVADATEYTLNDVPPGIYFIAVTAYDTSGNESAYSNEVSRTVE